MKQCIENKEWSYRELKMYKFSESCVKNKTGCTDPDVEAFVLQHIEVLAKSKIPKTIWSEDPDLNNDGIVTDAELKKWEAKKSNISTIVAVFVIPILILVLLFTLFYAKQKISG